MNLITIDNKPYEECEVLMLETKDKTNLGLTIGTPWFDDGTLIFIDEVLKIFNQDNLSDYVKYQHMYFLSSDEIKEGDFLLDKKDNTIHQALNINKGGFIVIDTDKGIVVNKSYCKKIIACTDNLLFGKYDKNDPLNYLPEYIPQPSPEFIEQFVESFNIEKPITRVLVEREWIKQDGYAPNIKGAYITILKLINNIISIKQIEDTDADKIRRMVKAGVQHTKEMYQNDGVFLPFSFEKEWNDFTENWIKENLK